MASYYENVEFAYKAVKRGDLEIDSEGRIWKVRFWATGGRKTFSRPRRRAECNSSGYLQVCVVRRGRVVFCGAHRLVWRHFSGQPLKKGLQINHKNGIRNDNRPENLELVTPKANSLHATRVLGKNRGELNPTSKLTERQVREIRKRFAKGERTAILGPEFGVRQMHIYQIVRRRCWAHVE